MTTWTHPAGSLGVGFLGVGRIGRMHAQIVAQRIPGAHVAAVFDVSEAAAREVGGALGVPVLDSAEDVLASADVAAVAVCTSTESHAPLIAAAAEAGKAILCEKPVSLELEEVDRALAAVEAAGVPFQIGFNRRFDPAHASVREAVVSGAIGEPHVLRISSRDPAPPPLAYVRGSGGLFVDMMIHDFDMARFVAGSEVLEVYARGSVRIEPAFADVGDVDTAVVTLTHANGCLTTIDNSRQAVYGYDQRVEMFGSAGMAASENPLAHTGVVWTAEGTRGTALPYFFLERYTASYVHQWEAFVAALAAGEAPPVGPLDARAPLVLGLAASRSVREDRPVRVAEVDTAARTG